MFRSSAWAAVVLAAVASGCGPGKEVPSAVTPRPKEQPDQKPDPFGPAPSKSDETARAVVDRAVKVVTENVPGGLEKSRVFRLVYKGTILRPEKLDMVEVTRTAEGVWPDRGRVTDEYAGGIYPTMSFRLRRPLGWVTNGPIVMDRNPAEVGRVLETGLVGEYWLQIGQTFSDPRLVAFGLEKSPAGELPAGTVVKVALPDQPIFRITFDEKLGVPVRVEYHSLEWNNRSHKIAKFGNHKPFAGRLLPGSVDLTQDGRVVERWATDNWEFPEKIDDARFEQPKP